MFFRGRTPEASIWRRFRASADGFTFVQDADDATPFTKSVTVNEVPAGHRAGKGQKVVKRGGVAAIRRAED